jgi:hypothetical protein
MKFKISTLALLGALCFWTPAAAFCLFGCEPKDADVQSVFENLVKKKFDPYAKIVDFKITRFWRLDVTGADHKAIDYFFAANVQFPKGANLDCKPEGPETKANCSTSKYFSTTLSGQAIKERQYVEPGATIAFSDDTRLEQYDQGWKGRDGNFY